MDSSHSPALVLLAIIVSVFGSYTGLTLAARARCATGGAYKFWLIGAAIGLGGGAIWSMHFIAMLAMHIEEAQIRYDVPLTLLSLGLAIIFTGLGLSLVSRFGSQFKPLALAGALMGIGVAAMHYTGMAAIRMSAHISYDVGLVTASLIVAVIASTAALWLLEHCQKASYAWLASAVMAAAVTCMHYTGMAAAEFTQNHGTGTHQLPVHNSLSSSAIALCVSAAMCAVLLLGLLGVHLDKRSSSRASREAEKLAEAYASEARWRATLDLVPQMIWSMRADGAEEYYNAQWLEFTGAQLNGDGAIGRIDLVHPEDREATLALWNYCSARGTDYQAEYRIHHRSGDYRWILSRGRPERDPEGRIVRWYGTVVDIHDRKCGELALKKSESLCRGIIAASPDCVSLLDLDGNVTFVNDAVLRAYGTDDPASLVGISWGSKFSPAYQARARHALAEAQAGRVSRLLLPPSDETTSWWDVVVAPVADPSVEVTNIVVISRDVTHQKKAEEGIRWAANHDMLTKLPNRVVLQQRVDHAISAASATGGHFALLLLDVDQFKQINDTLGHEAGDQLLCTFASRLRSAVREDDTVARLGGDEFAVVLNGISSERELDHAVKGILDAFRDPYVYSGRMLDCQASIGAGIFPQQGTSRIDLMKNADVALYAAKAAGRANYKLFAASMRAEVQKRSSMLNLAKDALEQDRIVPYYQPKIDLRTGAVSGFEALLRWRHPTRGIQPPSTIAAAFEDLTRAAQISDRMIECAIGDMRRWLDAGVDFGHVALNAAAAEFRQGEFAERLLERLDAASIPLQHVQIEVTETVFLGRGADYVERALKTLSREGVTIALDDFGTGFASLSHLKQFPVDVLKIDRSFVRDLHTDPDDAAIVDAVINLGRSLNMEVVAEGIETVAQHSRLAALGCHFGQGYLYGKATAARRVPSLVLGQASNATIRPPRHTGRFLREVA